MKEKTDLQRLKEIGASFKAMEKATRLKKAELLEIFSRLKYPNHHFTFWMLNNWDFNHLAAILKIIAKDLETIISNYERLEYGNKRSNANKQIKCIFGVSANAAN